MGKPGPYKIPSPRPALFYRAHERPSKEEKAKSQKYLKIKGGENPYRVT